MLVRHAAVVVHYQVHINEPFCLAKIPQMHLFLVRQTEANKAAI